VKVAVEGPLPAEAEIHVLVATALMPEAAMGELVRTVPAGVHVDRAPVPYAEGGGSAPFLNTQRN